MRVAAGRGSVAAGFSLLETVCTAALVGLCAMAVVAVLPTVVREAGAQEESATAFEHRWLPVQRLRADVQQAARARITSAGALRLEDAAGGVVTWTSGDEGLVRESAGFSRATGLDADERSFRLQSVRGRTLVVYAVGSEPDPIRGRALVGRDVRGDR